MSGNMTDRKLVTIRTIKDIKPIDNADNIEVAVVDGWECVVKKGEFKVGDEVFYFEIDSALPVDREEFSFLESSGVKDIGSRSYHILRTRRLRGVYSQGLLLSYDKYPEFRAGTDDPTEFFEVLKWETPIPAELHSRVRDKFPIHLVLKTDAERVQNFTDEEFDILAQNFWYPSEKVDGTSTTYIVEEGGVRVCSRNWELIPEDTLTQVKVGKEAGIWDLEPGYIIQGEVYGEGIQKNPLRIQGQRLAVFNVFFKGRQLPLLHWPKELEGHHAPVLDDLSFPGSVGEAVDQVDGLGSQIAPGRLAEGVVWHSPNISELGRAVLGGRACFKAINNKYLSKQKD